MELTTKNLIVLDLDSKVKEDIIKIMAQKMVEDGVAESYEEYLSSLFEREEIAATTVGYDVGLPHGKSKTIKKAAVAFARLKNPVVWNLEDNEKVKMIFMLAVPEIENGTTDINILVELSKKILDKNFRDKLSIVKEIDEVVKLING